MFSLCYDLPGGSHELKHFSKYTLRERTKIPFSLPLPLHVPVQHPANSFNTKGVTVVLGDCFVVSV